LNSVGSVGTQSEETPGSYLLQKGDYMGLLEGSRPDFPNLDDGSGAFMAEVTNDAKLIRSARLISFEKAGLPEARITAACCRSPLVDSAPLVALISTARPRSLLQFGNSHHGAAGLALVTGS
jgi:hypothetical protein